MLTAKSFLSITLPLSLVMYFTMESFIVAPRFFSGPIWLAALAGLVVVCILFLMKRAEGEERRMVKSYKK